MAKSFKNLTSKMSKEALEESNAKYLEMKKAMPLNEFRNAMHMSQERIAQLLNKKQANVSRMERSADMYISTLKSYIEAMGGQLEVIAKFPDGEVKIDQFSKIDVKKINTV